MQTNCSSAQKPTLLLHLSSLSQRRERGGAFEISAKRVGTTPFQNADAAPLRFTAKSAPASCPQPEGVGRLALALGSATVLPWALCPRRPDQGRARVGDTMQRIVNPELLGNKSISTQTGLLAINTRESWIGRVVAIGISLLLCLTLAYAAFDYVVPKVPDGDHGRAWRVGWYFHSGQWHADVRTLAAAFQFIADLDSSLLPAEENFAFVPRTDGLGLSGFRGIVPQP